MLLELQSASETGLLEGCVVGGVQRRGEVHPDEAGLDAGYDADGAQESEI